ncbi:uncharacterized protein EDB93DRAFT_1247690 [Suillus bovinus]|uniref:uncharacterized protein n=1 Tax=Suillus bovinus TaxID=48563 RepID=UPI001B87BDC0|nr:uncharacterized protein EDB93DRAFT_1247690 [Suillus bovinus]KAG2155199.1 hypothetical protein EDB93DRAFT_1247690 [Suillus bovinus]
MMQLSTALPTVHVNNAQNYVFVQARNEVMRLVPLRIDEVHYQPSVVTLIDPCFQPFQGLSGQFSFLGYVTHAYHLSPLYWPEECCGLADELLQQVGLLGIIDDISRYTIYEVIEHGGASILENTRTPYCGASTQMKLVPMWMLHELHDFQFSLAMFPYGFPPPVKLSEELSWQHFDQVTRQSLPGPSFHDTSLHLPLDFDYDPSVFDVTTASTFSGVLTPALEEEGDGLSNAVILPANHPFDGTQLPHKDLHWRQNSREDPLSNGQRTMLKSLMIDSPWARPYKLARYLYVGCLLVGIPANPFNMPELVSRQFITTSFLKALFFTGQTYESLCNEKLRVTDKAGRETLMDWSYLRNRFPDLYIEFTSELRKVTRGSMNVTDGFMTHETHRKQKILDLISYLQKGVVGVLSTLMFQGLTHPPQSNSHLKAPALFPIIMTALDNMYKHPGDFSVFFKEAHELLFLKEENVLVLEPKHGIPKVMSDGWRKTLEDVRPIEVKSVVDFKVPNAEFAFPVTGMAQIHISYFKPSTISL